MNRRQGFQRPQGQNNTNKRYGNQNSSGINQQYNQQQQNTVPVPNMWQPYGGSQQQQQQQQSATLADYMRGTWNNPAPPIQPYGAMNLPMPAAAPAYPPATPTRATPGQHGSQTPRGPASRSGNNALRPPRARAPVPTSDPHMRVPANYLFPQVAEQIGEGLGSGRNWLVIRVGTTEPVLRAPLLIARCKRDPINQQIGTPYPTANDVIPAGTSLRQVCQRFPRHVWGDMLRIFLSEQWDARRIWDMLPQNMRNNSSNRPWNYLQAAMGREVDTMMQEETGVRRVPLKKARTPTPTPEVGAALLLRDSNMINDAEMISEPIMVRDEGGYLGDHEVAASIDWSNEETFTLLQLEVLTRTYKSWALHAQTALMSVQYSRANDAMVRRFYGKRHTEYHQWMLAEYRRLIGPIQPADALEIHRLIWEALHPRQPGEALVTYQTRAEWHAMRNYAGVVQRLWKWTEKDYWELVGGEPEEEVPGWESEATWRWTQPDF
ncbi:hypothetical protein A1O7_09557 [Cladophialophora yegresii CBS 114405]|uniref:Uncharacterized protein n=1 Tax=Cladophialophora yegresii CBS 114405 TaxID=1182544 RepID=W9VMH8_9EURO|nr:uncharacterized protein A1O7_09557 [Cladophialophora yegresii CBS 114405]EXJ54220.1 hypothetical protein A1O7_09557 [Cladophialophora yegresii CBS 114405]